MKDLEEGTLKILNTPFKFSWLNPESSIPSPTLLLISSTDNVELIEGVIPGGPETVKVFPTT